MSAPGSFPTMPDMHKLEKMIYLSQSFRGFGPLSSGLNSEHYGGGGGGG